MFSNSLKVIDIRFIKKVYLRKKIGYITEIQEHPIPWYTLLATYQQNERNRTKKIRI